jgi:hypothetical protein
MIMRGALTDQRRLSSFQRMGGEARAVTRAETGAPHRFCAGAANPEVRRANGISAC